MYYFELLTGTYPDLAPSSGPFVCATATGADRDSPLPRCRYPLSRMKRRLYFLNRVQKAIDDLLARRRGSPNCKLQRYYFHTLPKPSLLFLRIHFWRRWGDNSQYNIVFVN